jgi:hypothetical protein
MNTFYTGTFTKYGVAYKYCGFWTPVPAGVIWKAVVRKEHIVGRPSGTFENGSTEQEILRTIRGHIKASVTMPVPRERLREITEAPGT